MPIESIFNNRILKKLYIFYNSKVCLNLILSISDIFFNGFGFLECSEIAFSNQVTPIHFPNLYPDFSKTAIFLNPK